MKKDIIIPEISDVEMAIVYEYNTIYNTNDWNVYLVNNNSFRLEMMVIVSKGFGDKNISSVMRKKIDVLDAHSFAKIEWIQPDLFKLTNQFQVTFFVKDRLYDKTFTFKENTIKEGALRMIPELKKRGIVSKQE
ncbi:hypothetical protein N9290_03635 [Flavobacteriaceae bacterium]|jgi:hypothetical protein|nr:hypothetical protein [Flavobacteriaceae bacterium]MDB3914140.1 hypothetical protein [Flavobacteriaceae bacterium]MDB4496071.1 hypothetical protein [Flavobacteriaceae bacterium]MDB4560213.1 hypothetical protein [Flavobacteriaceae bacterium]MDC1168513.1 hypothetical protein [Flavobacteriaceae bacterium]